jgi:hypothetical protein
MLSVDTGPRLGTVETIATSGRGLNPEELVRLYLPKIIYVGPDLAPSRSEDERLRAEAQKAAIESLLLRAFAQAQKSQNTTIYNVLMEAGETSAAELVRSL